MAQGKVSSQSFRGSYARAKAGDSTPILSGSVRPDIARESNQTRLVQQALGATLDDQPSSENKSKLAAEISVELAKLDDDEISDRRSFVRGYLARAKQRESRDTQNLSESTLDSLDVNEPEIDLISEDSPSDQDSLKATPVGLNQANYDEEAGPAVLPSDREDTTDLTKDDSPIDESLDPENDQSTVGAKRGQETSTAETEDQVLTDQMNQRADRIQSVSAALSTVVLVVAIGLSLFVGFGSASVISPLTTFAIPILAVIGVALIYIEARAEHRSQ